MSDYRQGSRGGYGGGRGGGRGGHDGSRGGGRGGHDGGRGGGRGGHDGGRGGGRGGHDGGRGGGHGGYGGGRGGGRGGGGRGRGHGAPSSLDPSGDIKENNSWPDQGVIPERRIVDDNEKPDNPFRLLKDFADLKIERSIDYTPKPPPGTSGRSIALLANYFMLQFTFSHTIFVHHYDVTIEKQFAFVEANEGDEGAVEGAIPGPRRRARKLERRFNRLIIEKMANERSGQGGLFEGIIPIYDSAKNLYLKSRLDTSSKLAITDQEGTRFRIEVEAQEFPDDQPSIYIVSLKHVADIEINPDWSVFPQDAIQFVDILLRHGPTKNKVPVGCKLFFPHPIRRYALPMNKELSFGFYQSARNCEGGLMLNVDRAASVFHSGGSMLTVFKNCIKGVEQFPRIPPQYVRQMSNELRGMRVKVNHLRHPMRVRVNEFSMQPASELTFRLEERDQDGRVISTREITVAEYFRTTYRELRLPHLPCLVAGSRRAPKYFPLEVCELMPDQYVAKKLHSEVLSAMTQLAAAQKPNARFNEITDSLKNCIRRDGAVYNEEFGIEICPNIVQVNGRVLDSPSLKYRDDVRIMPSRESQDCSWMMQRPTEKKFYNSVAIQKWVIVDMSRGNPSLFYEGFLDDFATRLTQTARSLGVDMSRPSNIVRHNFRGTKELESGVFTRAKSMQLQFMVFMIPEEDACYHAVKKLGDLDYGIVTQCCSTKHFNRDRERNKLLQTPYLTNLMLKINAKMNGVNAILDVGWAAKKKIMFVGIDVTHPAPGDRYSLSIASCVGSYDNSFVRYEAKLTAQPQTRRETVNLGQMMKELLSTYRKHNNCVPETIIVYRDGVSEGQFKEVMAFEVTKLLRLFEELKIRPKLTYMIVQKRHHTRFLTVDKSKSIRSLNVPAGTTVDTIVTDPLKFDFFICSHSGLLGTSRPSRYWVLFDQNNFTPDIIQQVTYFMCFLYPRCTRSVSIPVPVQFAHLSAYRARHHIMELFGESSASSVSSVGSNSESRARQERERNEHAERLNRMLRVQQNLKDRLYFL